MGRPRKKRPDLMVRVDKETWGNYRQMFPNETDQTISRIMGNALNTKLLKTDEKLRKMDFKNKFGRAIYGRKIWDKFFK